MSLNPVLSYMKPNANLIEVETVFLMSVSRRIGFDKTGESSIKIIEMNETHKKEGYF